jgi:hypothetical protein
VFTDDDLLALAAILGFLQSFDYLDHDGRRHALGEVLRALAERTGAARSEQIGGYRDAVRIVQALDDDLEPWLTRAHAIVGGSQTMLENVVGRVRPAARAAVLAAAQTYAEQNRLEPNEEMFLSWLSLLWHETPREL